MRRANFSVTIEQIRGVLGLERYAPRKRLAEAIGVEDRTARRLAARHGIHTIYIGNIPHVDLLGFRNALGIAADAEKQ